MKISRREMDKVYNPALIDSSNIADKKQKNGKTTAKDKIVISDKAKEYSHVRNLANFIVKEVTKQTPADKLIKLKSDVASGKYFVASEDIAQSIIGYAMKAQ